MPKWADQLTRILLKPTHAMQSGTPTQIGNRTDGAGVGGVWNIAEPSRAQVFLHPDDWHREAYFILMDSTVTSFPELRNGCIVKNLVNGLEVVLRKVDDGIAGSDGNSVTLIGVVMDHD